MRGFPKSARFRARTLVPRAAVTTAALLSAATPVVVFGALAPASASAAATASITKLDPNEVFTIGNDLVFIEGTGLDTVTSVTVDGVSEEVTDEGDGTLSFFTPEHAAGTAQVRLVTPGGTSTDAGTLDDLSYVVPPPSPIISSVTPNAGPLAGGNTVTIKGQNLGTALGVVFGDFSLAEDLVVVNDTTLTVTVPAGEANGKVDILVINPGGSNSNTEADDYTYGGTPTNPTTPAATTPAATTPKTTPAATTPAATTPKTTPAATTPKTTPAATTPKTTPAATTPGTTPGGSAKLTLTYQCTYPLIGEAPLKVDIDAAIPSSTPAGVPTAEFKINTIATASGNTYTGINLIGAKKIEGAATAKSTVALPGGVKLPVSVPITVAPYDVPATPQDLVLSATGVTPSLTFPNPGTATVTVDSIALSLKAIKADGTAVIFPGSDTDSDKDVNTFDVTCRLDPTTQSTVLQTIQIIGGATTPKTTPVNTTPVNTTPGNTTPVGTTPAATTPKTTPAATTPVVTTPKTTPVATTPKTTPVATTPKTTPVVTTPVVTTPKTTPAATTPGTTPGGNAKLTLTYQCTYPLIGEAPLSIDIDAAIPATVPAGVPTGEFVINTVATASGNTYTGISLIGAKKIEGSATAKSTVALPGGINLPVSVPITVAPYDVPATPGNLVLNATGKTPSLTFPTPGEGTITVDSIALSLKAIKADGTAVVFPGSDTDSDKDVNTFDVTCRLDPTTQSTVLRKIQITGGPVNTTPIGTTPRTTPIGTTPRTTPIGTTPKTTPGTSPVATTPKTTPAATTPVVTTPKTTPIATTPKTTPVATTPKTTPVATTPKTTPVVTTPGTTPGGSAKLTLTYQCTYPLIGEAPLKIDIDAAIPASVPAGVPTGEFKIDTVATASGNTYTGISLIGAKKIQGSATAKSTVKLPGGASLPVSVPITVAPYDVPATPQDLVLNASGVTPSLTFPTPGTATITVDSIALSLKAIKADGTAVVFPGSGTDSDKDESTFDVTCRLDPTTQNTVLRTIEITGAATTPADTTPIVTTPDTTPVVTTPDTTPVVTTPVVTTPATTPVVTTPTTTPAATTPATTPVVTTPVGKPTLKSIAPYHGPEAGGNTVTVTGTNLTGASVLFGTKPATGVSVSADGRTATATAPAGVGTVKVTVKTTAGTSGYVGYKYDAPAKAPVIRSLSPSFGLAYFGGVTTVFGDGLSKVKSVKIGTKSAYFTQIGNSLIVFAPGQKKGKYPFTVTTAVGTSNTVTYTYIGLF